MATKSAVTRARVRLGAAPVRVLFERLAGELHDILRAAGATAMLVTHDQDLMEEVGTRVWHFDGETISDFKGTYEEYAATLA